MSQALNRLRAMMSLPNVFPANAAAPPDGRPRMDGVMGWSRVRVEVFRRCRKPLQ